MAELIFANARIKSKELELLSNERLLRILECVDIESAVKILHEINYGGNVPIKDFSEYEVLLRSEENITLELIKSLCPEGLGVELLFLKYDYHNLKAMLKALVGKIENYDNMMASDINLPFNKLKELVFERKIGLNTFMENVVSKVYDMIDSNDVNPRLIDTLTDTALYDEIKFKLKSRKIKPFLKDYFVSLATVKNIATFIRTIRIKQSFNFFKKNFLDLSEIDLLTFEICFNEPITKLKEVVKNTKYENAVSKIENLDVTEFDTECDNFILKFVNAEKNDMFSAAPIVNYLLCRQNEIKVLRIALVCIKNKVPKEELKKRLRCLYV